VSIALCAAAPAYAETTEVAPEGKTLSLLEFRANGYFAMQEGGGDTITGQISWNPTYSFGRVSVRGNLGVGLLKGSFEDKFISINYQALAHVGVLGGFGVEAGGGMQTWMDNGGTHPIFSGNLVYDLKWMVLNRVFAGYSYFLLPNNATQEIRLGIGISI
jgi:hypothetical protein